MNAHEKINYIELPAKDVELAKEFFGAAFGWGFKDYGPEYTAFSAAGIDGGFYKSDLVASTDNGSVLVVIFSNNLEETLSKIEKEGGKLIVPIFEFPGGRRFHFCDPNGNEFSV